MRQETFFYYLFGVQETDFYGCINLDTEEAVLFAPEQSPLYKIFMLVLSKEEFEKKYETKTLYTKEMEEYVAKLKPVLKERYGFSKESISTTGLIRIPESTR